MDVDAVEKRTGDAVAIALDLDAGTAAFALRVAVESAWAGIHSRNQNKFGRECHGAGGTGNSHLSVFDRLAHDLECGALEFRQLVKEEDSIVRDAHLPRRWVGRSAQESDIADGMVGRAERALGDEGIRLVEQTANAVDFCGLDGLIEGHGRNDRRNALGEHALARAGWAYEQEIVSAGHGDLYGTLDLVLAFDL